MTHWPADAAAEQVSEPPEADLSSPGMGHAAECWGAKYPQFISHIVLGKSTALLMKPGSFTEHQYDAADRPATVSDLLGRVPDEGELERAVLLAFGLDQRCMDSPSSTSSLEAELVERYRSEEWTWRR